MKIKYPSILSCLAIRPASRAILAAMAALALTVTSSQAAVYTWVGTSGTNFSDTGNWSSATAGLPATSGTIALNASSTGATTINISTTGTIGGINVTNVPSNFVFTGEDLTFSRFGITTSNPSLPYTITFNNNVNLGSGFTVQGGTSSMATGGYIFNGNVTVSGTTLSWKGYNSGSQINGVLGGANNGYISLTLSVCGASGGVLLSNSNNRLSSLTISAATVTLGANNALGTGTGGTGPVVKMTRQFAGTIDMNGYNQIISGATMTSSTFNSFSEAIRNNKEGSTSTLTYSNSTGDDTFGVSLSGAGAGVLNFVKDGTNTLRVDNYNVGVDVNSVAFNKGSKANTYTGTTTVKQGTLLAVTARATGYGAVTVESGATFGGIATSGTALANSSISVAADGHLLAGTGPVDTVSESEGLVGSLGTLTISGSTNLTMEAGSVLDITVDVGGLHSTLAKGAGTDGIWSFDADQLVSLTMITADASLIGSYDNLMTGIDSGLDVSGWTLTNAGYVGTFVNDGSNIDLVVASVPEPSAAVLVGAVGAAIWVSRRRKKIG